MGIDCFTNISATIVQELFICNIVCGQYRTLFLFNMSVADVTDVLGTHSEGYASLDELHTFASLTLQLINDWLMERPAG